MRFRNFIFSVIILISVALVACGGGSGTNTPLPPTPPQADVWKDVKSAIDASAVGNIRLIVGDGERIIFTYEKGSLPGNEQHRLASASKLLSGIIIYRLVESGALSLDDKPAGLIAGWTQDPLDDRSQITLEQLLSFTSGFNYAPVDPSCVGNGNITMGQCALQYHDDGLDAVPGEEFYYGAAHLQIAGHMAEVATGLRYSELFQSQIVDQLGLGVKSVFELPSITNPRASAGAQSTANDYAEILRALLAGELITDMNTFRQDRTAQVVFGHRPASLEGANLDWHYGLGFWRECNKAQWDQACIDDIVMSSPGAFGWVPWIDFTNNYFGLIAMESIGNHRAPELEREIQPLIEAALAKL